MKKVGFFLLWTTSSFAAHYEVDRVHSRVGFSAKHLAVSRVTGSFQDFSGVIDFDPQHPEKAQVDFVVQARSLNTESVRRDTHLRSADFLDVEKYPTLSFKSTRIQPKGKDHYQVEGDLLIRGIKKLLSFEAEYMGRALFDQTWRAGFHAGWKINRKDFGMNFHKVLDTGGLLVSEEVDIQLDIEAIEHASKKESLAGV